MSKLTIEDVLAYQGYRQNFDCKDIKVMVIEGWYQHEDDDFLKLNGVDEISLTIPEPVDGMIMDHATMNAYSVAKYLLNSKVSLYQNTPTAYAEWYQEQYHTITMSMSAISLSDGLLEKMSKETFLGAASGNSGSLGVYDTYRFFTLCGACSINDIDGDGLYDDGEVEIREYSSYSDENDDGITEVDTVGIDGYYALDDYRYGTSYSTPLVIGVLLGQYYQLFYNKYHVFPTPKQAYQFLIDNSHPLKSTGFDETYGYGLFILPNDNNIKFFNKMDIDYELINSVKLNAINSHMNRSSNLEWI